MAGIAIPIQELLQFIEENSSIKFARIWNNQFQWIESQEIEAIPFPCAFVEVSAPKTQLGLGIVASDVTFKIHIGAREENAADTTTIGQNVSIFTLRNEIFKLLNYKEFTACSGFQLVDESQDFEHTNIYHYILEFVCSFIDNTADKRQGQTVSVPPVTLVLEETIVTEITT